MMMVKMQDSKRRFAEILRRKVTACTGICANLLMERRYSIFLEVK